jgi:hypothetical protein
MTFRHLRRSAALGLALAALAAPTALAQSSVQDLRGADAQDAAYEFEHGARQDLRSPDSQDRAAGTFDPPAVTVVRVPESAPASSSGRSWVDVAIGAGFGIVLGALGVAGAYAGTATRRSVTSRTA